MKSDGKRQGTIQLLAPAKITPYLRVLERRPDGYHDVDLALVPISLYDSLNFRLTPGAPTALTVESPEPLGPEADNLVLRAARAYREALAEPVSAAIHLTKRIPAAAGLGGGSADAAATLVALERLMGSPLGPGRLREIAAGLGADVPFFLDPRPCRAQGSGKRLQPLPGGVVLPLVVVKPAFPIRTAEAYGAVRPSAENLDAPGFPRLGKMHDSLHNDFEAALFPRFPELGAIKARLLAAGALGALLSGTGSAVFGVFPSETARDGALDGLSDQRGWRVFACRTLTGHDYFAETVI